MEKTIEDGLALLRWVKKAPTLWECDRMKEFCNLAYEITGDPSKFRPRKEEGWVINIDDLTKDVGSLLFDRGIPIMKPHGNICLLVTHAEMGTKSYELDNCTDNIRQWKFTAIDGDNKSIVLRIDTSLNTAGNLLSPGTVIMIESCISIYY